MIKFVAAPYLNIDTFISSYLLNNDFNDDTVTFWGSYDISQNSVSNFVSFDSSDNEDSIDESDDDSDDDKKSL